MKQRYIVHRAIDKNGNIVHHGIEIGGRIVLFTSSDAYKKALDLKTASMLECTYGISKSRWLKTSRSRGAVKFTKFIIFS